MAAFLAIATSLSNEAVKEVVTGETHRADAAARLESNRVKIDVAEGNSVLLRVLGEGAPEGAPRRGRGHGTRPVSSQAAGACRCAPRRRDRRHEEEVDHANTQHVDYELAEVGLQVGIVLASVSIIARVVGCWGLRARPRVPAWCSSWSVW